MSKHNPKPGAVNALAVIERVRGKRPTRNPWRRGTRRLTWERVVR